MTSLVQGVTTVLSIFTVVGDVIALFLLLALIDVKTKWFPEFSKNILDIFGTRAIEFSFGIAFISTLSSLFYSEIAGFMPCILCWWQRIFLYPQVFIFGLAWRKRDKHAADYGIFLSIVGGLIAIYHIFLQFGGSPLVPCAASGVSASCTQRYFLEFGYVTIPTMALTGFALIALFLLAQKAISKESQEA